MLQGGHDLKKDRLKDMLLGLHWAATTGNVGLIKFALDHGVPINSVVNGFVPLQLACINDSNVTAVQYLIDRGADVNIQKWSKKHSVDKSQAVPGATGSTALHVACANGCVKIVDLLLRNNARVHVRDKHGTTPMDIALAKKENEIIGLLKKAEKIQRKSNNGNRGQHQKSNSYNERKSLDFHLTHKRTGSEKYHHRIRRPSLPSIFERHSHHNMAIRNRGIHLPLSAIPLNPANNSSTPTFHHNHQENIHSCPSTPRCSIDCKRQSVYSPRSSEDSSRVTLSTSPSNTLYTPVEPSDWYGYGVVKKYDDDNYLVSLERRAYNLGSNNITNSIDHSTERRSIDSRRSTDSHTSYYDSSTSYHNSRGRSDSVESTYIDPRLQMTTDKNSTATISSLSLSANDSPSDEEDEVDDEDEIGDDEDGYEGEEEEDDEEYEEPIDRPTLALDDGPEADMIRLAFQNEDMSTVDNETVTSLQKPEKKNWLRDIGKDIKRTSLDSIHRRSLDFRPSFDTFTNLAKKGVEGISHLSMDESSDVTTDDDSQRNNQHGSGFFSKWVPTWSKRQ